MIWRHFQFAALLLLSLNPLKGEAVIVVTGTAYHSPGVPDANGFDYDKATITLSVENFGKPPPGEQWLFSWDAGVLTSTGPAIVHLGNTQTISLSASSLPQPGITSFGIELRSSITNQIMQDSSEWAIARPVETFTLETGACTNYEATNWRGIQVSGTLIDPDPPQEPSDGGRIVSAYGTVGQFPYLYTRVGSDDRYSENFYYRPTTTQHPIVNFVGKNVYPAYGFNYDYSAKQITKELNCPPDVKAVVQARSLRVDTPLTIPISATDFEGDGVSAIHVEVKKKPEGSTLVGTAYSGVGSATFSFTPEVEGEYQIDVYATDSLGATSPPTVLDFTVKPNIPGAPDIQNLAASPKALFSGGGLVKVSANIVPTNDDAIDPSSVKFYLKSPDGNETELSYSVSGETYSASFSATATGPYGVRVEAKSLDGLANSEDTGVNSVRLSSVSLDPENGSSGQSIAFSLVIDGGNMDSTFSADWSVEGQSGTSCSGCSLQSTGVPGQALWFSPSCGDFVVRAVLTDATGRSMDAQKDFHVNALGLNGLLTNAFSPLPRIRDFWRHPQLNRPKGWMKQ